MLDFSIMKGLAFFLLIVLLTKAKVCNFESHHTHLVIPLTNSREACALPGAQFLLSHGATFFCPHTYDVKQLATFSAASQDAQQILCKGYFDAVAAGTSIKFALRPTLPINGLPATGDGSVTSWTSPVMYHVHAFGSDNQAGPGNGWNTTTIYDKSVTVEFENVYFRQFGLNQPKPAVLSYLIYQLGNKTVLTHFISSAPCFDDILIVDEIVGVPDGVLSRYPLIVTFNAADTEKNKLGVAGSLSQADLYYQDSGVQTVMKILLSIKTRIYSGVDDGFADFGVNCPFPQPYPQHPSLCSGVATTDAETTSVKIN